MTYIRAAAGLLGILLLFVMLFSTLFIAAEATHDCDDGEDCPVCICIQLCEHLLHHSDNGTAVQAVRILPVCVLFFCVVPSADYCVQDTPVLKKVRLNN